jgi:hypothetical protein
MGMAGGCTSSMPTGVMPATTATRPDVDEPVTTQWMLDRAVETEVSRNCLGASDQK